MHAHAQLMYAPARRLRSFHSRAAAEADLVCRLPEFESNSRVRQIQIRMIGFVTGYVLTKMSRTHSLPGWRSIISARVTEITRLMDSIHIYTYIQAPGPPPPLAFAHSYIHPFTFHPLNSGDVPSFEPL